MVKLEPMSIEQYESWLYLAIEEYATEKIQAGNATADEARDVSKHEFDQLLPDGLNTSNNYLFNVRDEDGDHIVGTLWLKVRNEGKEMFIYGIRMDANSRGKGYGRQTMQALEAFVKEMGIPKISLHVFGYNDVAIKLYKSCGYVATNIRMSKVLTG